MPTDREIDDRILITIDLTEMGLICCFVAMNHRTHETIERLETVVSSEVYVSHTWTVDYASYLIIRDIISFQVKGDWKEEEVI